MQEIPLLRILTGEVGLVLQQYSHALLTEPVVHDAAVVDRRQLAVVEHVGGST